MFVNRRILLLTVLHKATVNFYQTTRCHIPQDSIFHSHHHAPHAHGVDGIKLANIKFLTAVSAVLNPLSLLLW